MKKISNVTVKLIFIGFVIGLLLLANVFIGKKMEDRQQTYKEAMYKIGESSGGKFNIQGVSLVLPYKYYYVEYENNKSVNKTREGYSFYDASFVNYKAKMNSEIRTLGIYSAPIFTGDLEIEAEVPVKLPANDTSYTYLYNQAFLFVKINDTALRERPVFTVNGKKYESYLRMVNGSYGIALDLPAHDGIYALKTNFMIKGSEKFEVEIHSSQTKLQVESDWTSPGFTSYTYLPDTRTITDQGFSAEWNIAFDTGCSYHTIGFDFIKPVNLYQKLDRAHSYAFLFIIVPFIVLFLFEIFALVNLHPMHYLLSGAASVLFFLLLLSFSEHISFGLAYLIGSFASSILVSVYIILITHKVKPGVIMCLIFTILYSYLYMCLKSEDYALLMGSIFAFILLAVIMFVTRKVNWSNLKKSEHTDLIKE